MQEIPLGRVGVGGGQVSTLHTLPRPEGYTPPLSEAGSGRLPEFGDKSDSLWRRWLLIPLELAFLLAEKLAATRKA